MSIILTIIFVFAVAKIVYDFRIEKNYSKESSLGYLSSTIGVLGTFIGIFIGLAGFDVNDMSTSVPKLLDGMKIAFATSIVGMAGAIYMKHSSLKNTKEEEEDIDDIVELFNAMIKESRVVNQTLLENQKNTEEIFNKINENWSNNQKELKEEIINLNNNTIAKQEELIKEFKKFGEEMAKSNSEALIEALNNVIKDFNNKISEQFGENFKELNEAVGALLVWQENYKQTIEITTEQLNKTFNSIKNVDISIEKIANNSVLIKENNENLNILLGKIDESQNIVTESIKSLVDVSNQAKESIPNIDKYFENTNIHIRNTVDNLQDSIDKNIDIFEGHVEKITMDVSQASALSLEEIKKLFVESNETFKLGIQDQINQFNSIMEELKICIPDINNHLAETQERFNNTLTAFTSEVQNALQLNMESMNSQTETLKNTTNRINNSLDSVITDSTKRLEDVTSNTAAQIREIIEEMEKVFEQKVEQLDKLLETELTKSLNSLGSQLITISERFSEDYTPLADKLREVVKIAERAR